MALLCKSLFGDDCTVGHISHTYAAPLQKAGINFVEFNLMDSEIQTRVKDRKLDVIALL